MLAGLAYGAWGFDDRRRTSEAWPYPGLPPRPAIAWYDSVSSGAGALEGTSGAPLAMLRGWSRSPGRPATRGVFGYRNGTFDVENASMLLQRGDSLGWIEADLASWSRGAAAAIGTSGSHRWGLNARRTAGAHSMAATYVQRGAATRLDSDEEQSGSGETGRLAWNWSHGPRTAGASIARAWEGRESFASDWLPSRRDAGALRAEARGSVSGGSGTLEARLGGERVTVRRDVDPGFDRIARAVSAGAALSSPLGDGTLVLDLAAVHHQVEERTATLDTLSWDRTRWLLVPEIAYRFDRGGAFGSARIARRAAPVWSDLAPAQAPFLQDTWTFGLEAGARKASGSQIAASVVMGRTHGRAILFRLPLEEQWLRLGAVRDPVVSEFALATLAGEWRARGFRVGGDVFGLARDPSPLQPAVDPGSGFRGWIEKRFRWFQDDLGVSLRADAAGVGARASETTTPLAIPGYVTFGASVRLELGDALILIRARNLENRLRPEPWLDLATGREALSAGRAIETSVTWALFD